MPGKKTIQLRELEEKIKRCRTCRKQKTGRCVAGEGVSSAKIIFIGEAPGRKEALSGRPFVGRSGKLLNTLLEKAGIKRKKSYITSLLKYFPGKKKPNISEIRHGRKHLDKLLVIVRPKLIVLLGNTALHSFFDRSYKIKKIRGKYCLLKIKGIEYSFLPTFHPAFVLRFPREKSKLQKDLKKAANFIKS